MPLDLVAPRYEVAREFRQPVPAPFVFGVDTLTMEELVSAPATAAILKKHAPWSQFLIGNPMFAFAMTVFTLRDAAPFMPMDVSATLDATDAALKALPRSEWPANVR
jgi:hypothetical protein